MHKKRKHRRIRLKELGFPIETSYWRPGEDYLKKIIEAAKKFIEDGDLIVVSEKALSVALGNIVDEEKVKPRIVAKILAKYWIPYFWGYILGPLCHLRQETIARLRSYPYREGSAHKEVALRYLKPIYALHWGSEGGIDASNLPYAYVSLPLKNPERIAGEIKEEIEKKLKRRITVMIVDTDKTYSIRRGLHLSSRPSQVKGIHSFLGPIAYILGRTLRLKRRSTPIALAGLSLPADLALRLAETADRLRGPGAGRTVWDMAEHFKTSLTGVTWKMLDEVPHRPIVVFKLSKISKRKVYSTEKFMLTKANFPTGGKSIGSVKNRKSHSGDKWKKDTKKR